MPNTSSSVPFLLSSSMQSIRSRRPSAVLGGSQGSGLLQQLGSGMVRLTSSHQPVNGRAFGSSTVRKCPSLNITFSWMYVRMTVVNLTLSHSPALSHTSHLSLSCIIIHRRGLLKCFYYWYLIGFYRVLFIVKFLQCFLFFIDLFVNFRSCYHLFSELSTCLVVSLFQCFVVTIPNMCKEVVDEMFGQTNYETWF